MNTPIKPPTNIDTTPPNTGKLRGANDGAPSACWSVPPERRSSIHDLTTAESSLAAPTPLEPLPPLSRPYSVE